MSALKNRRLKLLSSNKVFGERGFTLMEVTLTVALVLILSIGGFMAYQGFTDNAKRSAVESAANKVFNAAVATLMLPAQETSATEESDLEGNSGGVQFASHRVATVAANPAIAKIEEDYNTQNDYIQVSIEQAGMDVTVTATGWDGEYTAVRSTIVENDGVITGPGDNEEETHGEEVIAESSCENPENGCMVLTWDVSKSDNAVNLPISRTGKLKIDWGDGTVTEGYTLQHTYSPSDDSIYTIQVEGKFDKFGNMSRKNGLLSVDEWRNTETTSLSWAFYSAPDVEYIHEIPSGVKDMDNMFYGHESFNQDISSWDVSNVTNMNKLFYNATSFNNGDAPGEGNTPLDWDVSQVKNMERMFQRAMAFNQNVSSWDVSSVTNMENMFIGTTMFNNGDAPGESNNPLDWEDTSQVQNMTGMFAGTESFNQDISSWDVSSVTTMRGMLNAAEMFNNGDAPGESNNPLDWEDTSQVENMNTMFAGAPSFNQDISSWNVSSVIDMSHMFASASSFNQDVSSWDVSNVKDSNAFADGSSLAREHRPSFT